MTENKEQCNMEPDLGPSRTALLTLEGKSQASQSEVLPSSATKYSVNWRKSIWVPWAVFELLCHSNGKLFYAHIFN